MWWSPAVSIKLRGGAHSNVPLAPVQSAILLEPMAVFVLSFQRKTSAKQCIAFSFLAGTGRLEKSTENRTIKIKSIE